MKSWLIPYTRTSYGSFLVEAEDKETAIKKAEQGDFLDELDNKSNYDIALDKIEEGNL